MDGHRVPVMVRLGRDLEDEVLSLTVIWHLPDGSRRLRSIRGPEDELRREALALAVTYGLIPARGDAWIRHPASPRPDEADLLDPDPQELPRARRSPLLDLSGALPVRDADDAATA